jgi:hypothetical protein
MKPAKLLQGPCSHCGRTIRYPAHQVGTTGKCPGCGQITDLVLEEPDIAEGGISRRTLVWTLVTVLVLALGLVGAIVALKSARNLQQQRDSKPAAAQPAAPVSAR